MIKPSNVIKPSRLQHIFTTLFPSASNAHSPFLLHFSRECSNPLWNKLNPRNTVLRQGDITTSVHKLHKLWKAHAAEIRKNRSKKDNSKIDKDPPLKLGDRNPNHELQLTWPGSKILRRLEDPEIQFRPTGCSPEPCWRPQNTVHMACETCDLFKPSWNL